MITLDVQPYCHNCGRFEAHVDQSTFYATRWNGEEHVTTNTVIRCTHRSECRQMFQYLEEEFEKTKGANE